LNQVSTDQLHFQWDVIWLLTVNVGSSGAADVDDSATEEASLATEELASLRTD